MTNNININRKSRRSMGAKGMALAVAMAMAITAAPISVATVNAATSSSTYVAQATETFTFTESGATSSNSSSGTYKYVDDETNHLMITSSGTYIITGSCSDGSVTVKKGTTGVTLILQNLTLASSTGAPITINKNNTDTTIVIAGTNTLTDNEDPDDEDSSDEAVADAFEGAGIKLKSGGTLVITGDGTLNVVGNCKNGIKGGDESTITIGASASDTFTLNVTAANDGISGDGADGQAGLNIIGGNINVNAADDGIKSDYILNIGQSGSTAGATINVTNSYEGFEGATVNLYGGSASIVSSDDGINAANSDLSDYSFSLNIYGGKWDINAGGDGLDSNGTILVSGGVTDVSSSTQNDDNAIDWGDNSYINVTGGTIIGIGMSGMQEGFTYGNYVMFTGINLSKGNTVSVKDLSGNTLYTTTVKKSANSVIYSDESLTDGATYTLYVNGSQAATATEGTYSGGGMGPGGQDGFGPDGQDGMGPSGQDGFGPNGQDGMGPDGQNGFGPDGQDGNRPELPDGEAPEGMQPGGFDQDSTQPSNTNQTQDTDSGSSSSIIQQQIGAIYRMYNPNSGEHFYTEQVTEARALNDAGWSYENVAFIGSDPQSGTAVYRLYNPNAGDHHYTTDAVEAKSLIANGWTDEGIAFYAENSGSTPVYRLYNSNAVAGAHHYTTDVNEYLALVDAGWQGENIAWYTR